MPSYKTCEVCGRSVDTRRQTCTRCGHEFDMTTAGHFPTQGYTIVVAAGRPPVPYDGGDILDWAYAVQEAMRPNFITPSVLRVWLRQQVGKDRFLELAPQLLDAFPTPAGAPQG